MKRISEEEKQNIINSYKSGESVASISMRTEIPRSTIYGWIKAEQPKSNELPINKMTINNHCRVRISAGSSKKMNPRPNTVE